VARRPGNGTSRRSGRISTPTANSDTMNDVPSFSVFRPERSTRPNRSGLSMSGRCAGRMAVSRRARCRRRGAGGGCVTSLLRLLPRRVRRCADDTQHGTIARFEVKSIYLGLRLARRCGPHVADVRGDVPDGFIVLDYYSYVDGAALRPGAASVTVEWPRCIRGSQLLVRLRLFTFGTGRDAVLQLRDAAGTACDTVSGDRWLLRPAVTWRIRPAGPVVRGCASRHLGGDESSFQVAAVRVECRRVRRFRVGVVDGAGPGFSWRSPSRSSPLSRCTRSRVLVSCRRCDDHGPPWGQAHS